MAFQEDRLPERDLNTPEEEPKKKGTKKEGNFFKRMFSNLARWFREMKSELKKVVWPRRSQVVNNSIIVFVIVIVSAIVIWGFDQLAMYCVNALTSLGG
jgi:preprotein translocase subunit SecE